MRKGGFPPSSAGTYHKKRAGTRLYLRDEVSPFPRLQMQEGELSSKEARKPAARFRAGTR